MSKTLKTAFLSLIGFIVITVTLSVYFLLDFTKTPASNIGISFVLLAELALFGVIIGIGFVSESPNRLFLRTGMISGVSLYWVATVVVFFFYDIFDENVNGMWILEIIGFTVMLVIAVSVVIFSSKINSNDQKILSDRRLMQICEKRMSDLLSVNKGRPCEPQLVLILEKLKYCDKIGDSAVDEKIVSSIMRLEKELGTPEPNADTIFDELTALISQRNTEIAENRRGGF
ncbi:MAG: hypothetical protein LBI03_03245 [Clostridiales bacterium]|jgi:hypothetical protein|nr:hypothetical protein [Clostridiales bacterium]